MERDLTDVRDVCRAYRLLLDRSVPGGTYNVSSGEAVPLKRVVELLVEASGVPVTIERDPARIRPAEVRVVAGDASELRAATGWEPEIPLEQTLADMLEAAQQARATREDAGLMSDRRALITGHHRPGRLATSPSCCSRRATRSTG